MMLAYLKLYPNLEIRVKVDKSNDKYLYAESTKFEYEYHIWIKMTFAAVSNFRQPLSISTYD